MHACVAAFIFVCELGFLQKPLLDEVSTKNLFEVSVETYFMKHPKFLVEVSTETSMRFLEKIPPGVEVSTETYLRFL